MSETQTGAPLLPILIYPDSVLRKVARPITPADADEVRSLVPSMFATMYKAPGIGLAANQIGSLLRVIVVDVAPKEEPAPIALINPEIIARSDELATQEEGCLSIPEQYAEVTRPARVKVRYLD
ncbi:peptide deformylase, partial [Phocaeicola dorei]|uniref:peptide deformylase n=1 Tax=Phocaeicola dorei TaxID=357276 RepID=UPI001BDF2396